MARAGYIKLYRKLLDNQIFASEKGLKIWMWCLLKASHKNIEIYLGRKKEQLKAGQFIFGRRAASEELKMSGSTIWWWMNQLRIDTFIDIEKPPKYSIITILNWPKYQGINTSLD